MNQANDCGRCRNRIRNELDEFMSASENVQRPRPTSMNGKCSGLNSTLDVSVDVGVCFRLLDLDFDWTCTISFATDLSSTVENASSDISCRRRVTFPAPCTQAAILRPGRILR